MAPLRPAVFLDKDGTVIPDIPYNVDPARIDWMPGAPTALKRLHTAGYSLVIVSNQSGVAKGRFRLADLDAVQARLRQLLAFEGIPLAGFYCCPHHPEGKVAEYARVCECRKPLPGMLLKAAKDLHLDLAESWMIGDLLNDVEAGHRAGCRSILLDSGGETQWLSGPLRQPEFTTTDLMSAADRILNRNATISPPSLPGERYACYTD